MANKKHQRKLKSSLFTSLDLFKPDEDENKKVDKKLTPSQKKSCNHIMNHYSKILFHSALSKTKDRQAAGTITNNVLLYFAKSYLKLFAKNPDISEVKGWMFKMLEYKIKDYRKKVGRDRYTRHIDAHVDVDTIKVADEESVYKYAIEGELLDWAVKTHLPPNRQKIFYMAVGSTIKHKVIAQEVGMTTSSVKTVASRDKRMIKEKIKEKLENIQ